MIFTNSRPWGGVPGASTFGNNYLSVAAAGNLDNSNFVTGIDTFNAVPCGCTTDNYYLSAATARCPYAITDTAADAASHGSTAFFLNPDIQPNDNSSNFL